MNSMMSWVRCQSDRIAGWSLIGSGVVIASVAASQGRDNVRVADQLSLLLSGGVGSLAVALLGCGIIISSGFHDQWRKLDSIEAALGDRATEDQRPGLRHRLTAAWDRILGTAIVAVGFMVLTAGSVRASESPYASDQVAYVTSGGLGSLLLIAVGLCVVIFADLRDSARKTSRIAAGFEHSVFLDPSQEPERRSSALGPWLFVALVMACGAVLLVAGWIRASAALHLEGALRGFLLAVLGLGMSLIALVGFMGRIRNALAHRITAVLAPARAVGRVELVLDRLADDGLWTADGLSRYHASSCPALLMSRTDRREVSAPTDLEPCLLCSAGANHG